MMTTEAMHAAESSDADLVAESLSGDRDIAHPGDHIRLKLWLARKNETESPKPSVAKC